MPPSGNTRLLRSVKYPNSQVGSQASSSMRASTAAMLVAGWRFAPACCAAQSVVEHGAGAPCDGRRQRGLNRQPNYRAKFAGPGHRAKGAMQRCSRLQHRLLRNPCSTCQYASAMNTSFNSAKLTPQEGLLRGPHFASPMALIAGALPYTR